MIDLLGFVFIILPIALSPGTSFVLAMSNVSILGVKGIFPVLYGTSIGITIHALLAGIGVSGLLTKHHTVMSVMKLIGIAFLLFLGVRLILNGINSDRAQAKFLPAVSGVKDAFILNLVNVRAIVLYVTVIPTVAGGKVLNFLLLSTVHILILAFWIAVCAILLRSANKRFQMNRIHLITNVLGGLSLIGFAGKMLFENI